MKAEYKREMNRNYLVLTQPTDNYEIEMICNNSIDGFARVKKIEWDDEKYLYYDVTARQPIDKAFSKRKIGMQEMQEILYALDNIAKETKRFLLDSNNVLISPEYIFWDMKEDKIEWVFYPGNSIYTMNEFAEFILERMDTSDTEVVKMAYELYRRVKDTPYVENDYYDLLKDVEIKEEKIDTIYSEEIITPYPEENNKPQKNSKFKDKLSKLFVKKKVNVKQEEWLQEETSFDKYFESIEINNTDETTCLSAFDSGVHKLVAVAGGMSDVELNDYPYLLGSRKDSVDIYINDKAVSRMHAQIVKREEEIYIIDLSSTNGTYVNNNKIMGNESIIKTGDELRLGNSFFTFI